MEKLVTDIEKLRAIAIDQHSFITTSQAEEVGVSRPSLTYLSKNGRVERTLRGIYRVSQVPATQYDVMHLALLWADGNNAVLSHDTALYAWDVCDIYPTKIHVTVPKHRRISKADAENVVVYRCDIPRQQVAWWEQMPVVSLPLAIQQCIERKISSHLIVQAITNGRARGMLTKTEAKDLTYKLEVENGT